MNTENNKIMADFMGDENLPHYLFKSELKFDSDWNWLMAVVDKINKLDDINSHKWATKRFRVVIDGIFVSIKDNYYPEPKDLVTSCEVASIEATYNACVIFINWYNQQKN